MTRLVFVITIKSQNFLDKSDFSCCTMRIKTLGKQWTLQFTYHSKLNFRGDHSTILKNLVKPKPGQWSQFRTKKQNFI